MTRTGDDWLANLRARARLQGNGCYLGATGRDPVFAPPEQCTLVLGPPRSGKTTGIVIPNVLAAASVVVVSTKRDVLDATAPWRSAFSSCSLFDPSGTVTPPPHVRRVGWSPVAAAHSWTGAVAVIDSMIGAARPGSASGEAAHWSERAGALLSVLVHAAALEGASMDDLVSSVNRREHQRAKDVLTMHDAELPLDLLAGIVATDGRELSGIWSTASSVLAAYRTPEALESARLPMPSFPDILAGRETLYVVASAERQRHAAPIVAGAIRELREHVYRRGQATGAPQVRPVVLILDELANIAPLHDLPELVSEGGGQGLVTLACLQDLSQARHRWGPAADGFLTLFGAKLVLGGLGDVRSLEAVSLLAGEHDTATYSSTTSGRSGRSRTRATRRERRLPPDAVARLETGRGLLIDAGRVRQIGIPPFFLNPAAAPERTVGRDRMGAPRVREI